MPNSVDNSLWSTTKANLIPTISEELLLQMSKQITPLLKIGNGYHEVANLNEIDLRKSAYTWKAEPLPTEYLIPALESIDIITFHYFGAPSLFKPSIAEVMSCINKDVPNWFNKIKHFYLHSDNMGPEHVMEPYHWCRCTLIGRLFKNA